MILTESLSHTHTHTHTHTHIYVWIILVSCPNDTHSHINTHKVPDMILKINHGSHHQPICALFPVVCKDCAVIQSLSLSVYVCVCVFVCVCEWVLGKVYCPAGLLMLPCEIHVNRTGRGVTQMLITDVDSISYSLLPCFIADGEFLFAGNLITVSHNSCGATFLTTGSMTWKRVH